MVGSLGSDREYRVFWWASSFTGGLPVNYSIKLCLNDSRDNNNDCKWNFSDPDCRPANVLRTDKDFLCVLKKAGDFDSSCGKDCNYMMSVVAENYVGRATSWRYLPRVQSYSGNFVCFLSCISLSTPAVFQLKYYLQSCTGVTIMILQIPIVQH